MLTNRFPQQDTLVLVCSYNMFDNGSYRRRRRRFKRSQAEKEKEERMRVVDKCKDELAIDLEEGEILHRNARGEGASLSSANVGHNTSGLMSDSSSEDPARARNSVSPKGLSRGTKREPTDQASTQCISGCGLGETHHSLMDGMGGSRVGHHQSSHNAHSQFHGHGLNLQRQSLCLVPCVSGSSSSGYPSSSTPHLSTGHGQQPGTGLTGHHQQGIMSMPTNNSNTSSNSSSINNHGCSDESTGSPHSTPHHLGGHSHLPPLQHHDGISPSVFSSISQHKDFAYPCPNGWYMNPGSSMDLNPGRTDFGSFTGMSMKDMVQSSAICQLAAFRTPKYKTSSALYYDCTKY